MASSFQKERENRGALFRAHRTPGQPVPFSCSTTSDQRSRSQLLRPDLLGDVMGVERPHLRQGPFV